MESHEEVKALLRGTSMPCVVEGDHRDDLKSALLAEHRRVRLLRAERHATPFARRFAWAAVIALAVLSMGMGAREIYKHFIVYREVTNPSPGVVQMRVVTVTINELDATQEEAETKYREIQDLISRGEYKLMNMKLLPTGEMVYTYRLALSDGTITAYGTHVPLEKPDADGQ